MIAKKDLVPGYYWATSTVIDASISNIDCNYIVIISGQSPFLRNRCVSLDESILDFDSLTVMGRIESSINSRQT